MHTYKMEYYSAMLEKNHAICENMDGFWGHYAESDTRQIESIKYCVIITCMQNLKSFQTTE